MANHKRKRSKRAVRNAMDKESWFGNAKGRFKNKETEKRKRTKDKTVVQTVVDKECDYASWEDFD